MKEPGPWKKLYSNDEISEEARDTLTLYEALPVSERVQYFKKVSIFQSVCLQSC